MSDKKKNIVFSYSWHVKECDNDVTQINIFGLDEKNRNVLLTVNDFTPYIYIELPDIDWLANGGVMLKRLDTKLDEISGKKIVKKNLVYKKKLYYANKKKDKDGKIVDKLFPFLCCSFRTQSSIRTFSYKLKKSVQLTGLGYVSLKIHEDNASPVLQLTCLRDIKPSGWFSYIGTEIEESKKESTCDLEYEVKWKEIFPCDVDKAVNPLIMAFDLEVNSSDPNRMPDSSKPNDKIFQISCVLCRHGDPEDKYEKYLLSLGEPDQKTTGEEVKILTFKTEAKLLKGFTNFVQEKNPNIITGHNIFQFDIPYMIDRAKLNYCISEFDLQSFIQGVHGEIKKIKWSSSAYKNQEFEYLDCPGRLYIDTLPIIRRDYNLETYSLKNVSTIFIGQTKDPLTAKQIFRHYRESKPEGYGIVGKYCVQDSYLVARLFEKLQMWTGLSEMSKICNTMIFSLFTQGQQLKVFSQVYRDCMGKNYVVQKDGYVTKENEKYEGAYVFDPIPGIYDMVVSFDFSSLYPSTIIAYNIDYSTLVNDDTIPDSMCHIFDWESHQGCEHDTKIRKTKLKTILCGHYRFRFLKEPKGIIPSLLENLLGARKQINTQIKKHKEELKLLKDEKGKGELESRINILDKRQLAMKISANSMYGAFGVKKGYLPFIPGAMCTTARGRESIEKAAKHIQQHYGAKLIYGDSVTGDTPILVRYEDKSIDILRIDELGEVWEKYEEFKQEDSNRNDKQQTIPFISQGKFRVMNVLEVWDGDKWSIIKRVIRHKTVKKMYRVLTHTGCVDVTEDHSLLDKNREKIKPTDLNIGSELFHSFPPNEDFLEIEVKDSVIEGKVLECKKCKQYKLVFEFYKEDNSTPCKECVFKQNHKIERKTFNKEYISETEYLKNPAKNLDKDLAFVWGMFFAEGSCQSYIYPKSTKNSWAINNQDLKLLEKCKKILEEKEPLFGWKILDTIKSSNVYKLVPLGHSKYIVDKWRRLFYDKEGYKKVPYFILNGSDDVKKAFFSGYYEGDGDKHTFNRLSQYKMDIKGKIGAHGLFTLLTSLGVKVAINTKNHKENIYTLHTCKNFRKSTDAVKKITQLESTSENDYVYDIETDSGRFLGGIGKLVLKNTDSCYINFPQFKSEKDAKECYTFCKMIEDEMTSLFPKPMKLAYEEKIYWRFLILTKKRYMALQCTPEGVVKNDIFKRGVLLSRRDNTVVIRNIYSELITNVFYKADVEKVQEYILEKINDLFSMKFPTKDFITSKSVGNVTDYKVRPLPDDEKKRKKRLKDLNCTEEEYRIRALPAQVQLAERMKRRGIMVSAGSRIQYVITNSGEIDGNLSEKIEHIDYFLENSEILRLDYFYYLHNFINPLDEILEKIYNIKDFVKQQYKLRLTKGKLIQRIKALGTPEIRFQ